MGTVGGALNDFLNLTFFKDYSLLSPSEASLSDLSADIAAGVGTAIYTAARGASNPATWVNANGIVQTVVNSNVGRITAGFYDANGFTMRPGLIIEGPSTNLVPKASTINDATWTASNTTANNADSGSTSPDGTATAPALNATAANGTLLLTTAVTAQTFSVWLKRKIGTGNIQISADGGATWTTVAVGSGWARFQVTAASASQTCGIKIIANGDAIYVWGAQFEAKTFATTFIPTTNGALTRNGETLKYAIAGNRTAATETIFVKFTPNWNNADQNGAAAVITSTDTKDRIFTKSGVANLERFGPNSTDSTTALATGTSLLVAGAAVVWAAIAYGTVADINEEVYLNGVSEGNSNINYTSPAWGTNFYVGMQQPGNAGYIYGIIDTFAVFSDVKAPADVATISTIINNG